MKVSEIFPARRVLDLDEPPRLGIGGRARY